VLRRAHPALPVRRAHRHHAGRRFLRRVDHHERDAVLLQPRVLGVRQLGEVEQDSGRTPGGELVQPAALRTVVSAAPPEPRRDDDVQPGLVRGLFDAVQDRARPGAVERVQHQVDQPGRLRRVEPRPAHVPQPVQRLGDPAAGLRRDVLPAVDDLGGGRHRHPRLPCHDRQRRSGRHVRTRRADHREPTSPARRWASESSTSAVSAVFVPPGRGKALASLEAPQRDGKTPGVTGSRGPNRGRELSKPRTSGGSSGVIPHAPGAGSGSPPGIRCPRDRGREHRPRAPVRRPCRGPRAVPRAPTAAPPRAVPPRRRRSRRAAAVRCRGSPRCAG